METKLPQRMGTVAFVACLLTGNAGFALPECYLYWSSNATDTIYRANLDGSGAVPILDGRMNPANIDTHGGRLYWSEQWVQGVGMSVRSANLDGSGDQVLYSTGHNTYDMSIDSVSGDIYRLQSGYQIFRAQPVTYHETLVKSVPFTTTVIEGISYDSTSQRVIWVEGGTSPRIKSCNRDGSDVRELLTEDIRMPRDVEYDAASGSVYWLNGEVGHFALYRSLLNGTHPQLLASLPSLPHKLAVDSIGGQIYISDANGILRCGLDGSGLTRIQAADLVLGLAVWYVPEPACIVFFGGFCGLCVCCRRGLKRI